MNQNPFSIKNKTFLITGGTRGIGRAISLLFARSGAQVIANYVRDEKSAQSLLEDARTENLSLEIFKADLTSQKGLEKILNRITQQPDKLSGLIHCAATGVHKNLNELTTRHWDWTLNLNVRAFFELVQMLTPHFTDEASIIAISSQGARRAVPYYSITGSSKAALESLARHMAAELIEKGIRVNILVPGSINTGAWNAMPDKEKRQKETIKRTPLGRLITVEEIAQTALFLCSDAASGIIGQTIVIDGGISIVE